MFFYFKSEYVNRHVGRITLPFPNDTFYFFCMTIIFTLVVVMIISLSSSSSFFIPFLVLTIINVLSNLLFLFVLHTTKNWMHVLFSTIESIFVMEDIIRNKFSTRLPGGTKKRFRVESENEEDDEIGDVTATPSDKTLRINMDTLNNALKKNIFR
ncbi:MAG: hypothetical protein CBC48_10530 [bacterium TMED88]|nr:MAG: hypothetical protein CBC48_10530 [bacterium TMED88]